MNDQTPTASWTVTQPWRGIFGLAVTIGVALTITSIFDMKAYLGFFTTLIMGNVPILVVIGLGWQGQYPPAEGLPQPWRAMLFTAFVMLVGVLATYVLVNFVADGVAQPFIHVQAICTVIVTFYLVIAFGTWPFDKMSLPAKGFLTLILAYIVTWLLMKLFNYSLLSHPAGVIPSPIDPVPFYAKGGPLAAFAGIAPMGPFTWEGGLTYLFWVLVFLFCFADLQMWPFHKWPGVMKQPVMGIVVMISCLVLGYISYLIGVKALQIAPLRFLLYGICFLYGLLVCMLMFQMWPGRTIKSPAAGGFLNIVLAIVIAIIAYYANRAFLLGHFGAEAMKHPNEVFAMGNLMLGITFPAWAAYGGFWDFWPLPPSPPPPAPPSPE